MNKKKSAKYGHYNYIKDDGYTEVPETKSTKFLEKINFPVHKPTYNFVLVGSKTASGKWWVWRRMRKEDALRFCRMVMFYVRVRWAVEETLNE